MHISELWEMQQLFARCPIVNGFRHLQTFYHEFG